MPLMVPFQLTDISLTARDLAPGRAAGGPRHPVPLLTGKKSLLLLQLRIQFGAGAGDPTRQEIRAHQSRVALPHLTRPLLARAVRADPGLLFRLRVGLGERRVEALIEIEVKKIRPVEEGRRGEVVGRNPSSGGWGCDRLRWGLLHYWRDFEVTEKMGVGRKKGQGN